MIGIPVPKVSVFVKGLAFKHSDKWRARAPPRGIRAKEITLHQLLVLFACSLLCVCMYMCVYVCVYVCMYVCEYVCVYVCVFVCTYGWMDG